MKYNSAQLKPESPFFRIFPEGKAPIKNIFQASKVRLEGNVERTFALIFSLIVAFTEFYALLTAGRSRDLVLNTGRRKTKMAERKSSGALGSEREQHGGCPE